MWEGVLLLRIGKAASHILSSARVQMTFASGCFIATNWKTHWCLDSDLSIEIMWLQCWTCVSVLVETPLTFHWRWFLNTDCTRHDKVWDVILQVTSPLPSPLRAFKDPKRWPVRTCDALCQCSTGSISFSLLTSPWGEHLLASASANKPEVLRGDVTQGVIQPLCSWVTVWVKNCLNTCSAQESPVAIFPSSRRLWTLCCNQLLP